MSDKNKSVFGTSNQSNRKKILSNKSFKVNPLESLRESANVAKKPLNQFKNDTLKSLNKDLFSKMPNDFMDQLFGPKRSDYSADIVAGESLEMRELTTNNGSEKTLKRQISYERTMRREDEMRSRQKSQELRLQLQAISQEVISIAENTQELAQEVKIAAMQAPVEPGVYHIIFFTNLLSFLKSFRKKIESAHVWLHATNQRANKKGWVANYKKSGAKYLLSGEHYLSRNAG